ncbi:MAG TPA: ABC transporter permease [Planctomycetota bacterium]|nr:ABC transporter permease [Planctomycetota bacterium]
MTRVWRIVKLGLRSLLDHPLRSGLAVLGIVLGVASVIAMLAIGAGAAEEAQAAIRALGSTTIRISSKKPPEDQGAAAKRSRSVTYGITEDDRARIEESFEGVQVLVPVKQVTQSVYADEKRSDSAAYATLPTWLDASRNRIARGRWISDVDDSDQLAHAVLGANLAKKLFQHLDPIGRKIRIGQKLFTVIGVLAPGADTGKVKASDGQSGGPPVDEAAFVPMSVIKERYGERNVKRSSGSTEIEEVELHELIVVVSKPEDVAPVADAVRAMLRRFHKKEDYYVLVPLELLEQAKRTRRIFDIVLGSIAGISLVVGGIGIMNIMLATVTERTREIGVRRALGAKRGDITVQFLAEATVLSVAGGAMGVALGVVVPQIVEKWFAMRTLVLPESLVLSFGISAFVGVAFGIYPAIRASFLDPIEALRHE